MASGIHACVAPADQLSACGVGLQLALPKARQRGLLPWSALVASPVER
jgi:hypothetical protein